MGRVEFLELLKRGTWNRWVLGWVLRWMLGWVELGAGLEMEVGAGAGRRWDVRWGQAGCWARDGWVQSQG